MRKEGYFYSKKHKKYFRKDSIRLKGWDYASDGAYFVTVCVDDPTVKYFGDIFQEKIKYSKFGKCALNCWREIPNHFPHVTLDEFVVMPNHIHGILWIFNEARATNIQAQNVNVVNVETQNFCATNVETQNFCATNVETQNFASLQERVPHEIHANRFGPQSRNLGSIVRGFKIGVTKYAKQNNIIFSWQKRFFEHIIRSERALYNIRTYIKNNPNKWNRDRNNVW